MNALALPMDVLEQLSSLTSDQLREVASRASLLLSAQTPSVAKQTGDEELVFSVVSDLFKDRGLSEAPFRVIAKQSYFPKYRESVASLGKYIDRFIKPKTRVERRKVVLILVRMLIRWMTEASVPVSYKTVALNLSKVPDLVDRQFPGYRQSGLLPILVKQTRV